MFGGILMIYVMFIIPLMILVIGYLMNKYPPKKVNWFVGYRTRKSMSDENIWKVANEYCGKLWLKIGLIMIIVVALLCALIYLDIIIFSETFLTTIIVCEIAPLLLSGVIVDKKIRGINNSDVKK